MAEDENHTLIQPDLVGWWLDNHLLLKRILFDGFGESSLLTHALDRMNFMLWPIQDVSHWS